MPTAVACPKCQKKYSLPDQLLGKPVKCSACNTMFKVAAPVAAATQPARKPVAKVPSVNKEELARMGLDGPIASQPELFGEIPPPQAGNPLGNHVVVDPGFAEVDMDPEDEEVKENPAESIFRNPALQSAKPKRQVVPGKKKKRSLIQDGDQRGPKNQIMLLFSVGALLALTLTVVLPMTINLTTATKTYMYAIHPFMIFLTLAEVGWWMYRCWQARTSMGNFLLILIPLWIFAYSLNRDKLPWTKEPLITWFIVVFVYIVMVIAASFVGINEQWERLIEAGM